MNLTHRFRGSLLGLATGDSLGVYAEGLVPGSFPPVTDIVGGGFHQLPRGYWTDDTSMAICLGESLVEKDGFDAMDQAECYLRWYRRGYRSSIDACFGIGGATRWALEKFEACREPFSGSRDPSRGGNGSMMRLAPVPLYFFYDPELAIKMAADSSRVTHGAPEPVDGCRYLCALILGALAGLSKEEILSDHFSPYPHCWDQAPLCPAIENIASGSFREKEPPQIRGTGYVVDSLEAALWAFHRGNSFREGVLLAVNLGNDADTTGAVYGQIAGAYYGLPGIPEQWQEIIHQKDMIISLADRILAGAQKHRGNPHHRQNLS